MRSFALPGGLAGPPSACSCAANRIDVFAAGPGNTVWRWSWNGTNWTPPAPLPGHGSIPAEGVCAVASGPGRVEVFAAQAGTRTPVWWRGNNTQWSPGPALTAGANLPALPVAAVCASPDNIDVVAVGAGNAAWSWRWDGAHWTGPLPMPGGNLPAERIAAVSPAPGRVDVFAVGADTHLWHWRRVGGAPWSAAEDLGGNLPSEGVSAVSWGLNRIDVFAASRAPGNPLQHWWSTGGGFAGPENLGGSLAVGAVSAVSHAADRLDVFGVSGDQRIAHWQWDGQTWTGPGYHGDHIPAGDVSAAVRVLPSFQPNVPPRRLLDVFVTGAGNTLRQWPGGGLENATTQPWSNWPTNHEKNPVAGHLWPDSLDELVSIVKEAERSGQGVRAVGSSWSNSDVAVTPAYVVETDKLNCVLTDVLSTSLNRIGSGLQSRLVHVEAGIKLYELNDFLDGRGLALHTMGGSSGQSLAGVISTSAHGMDIDRGPIPDMVRAIHLVGPGGIQHWIEPSTGITDRDAVASVLGLPPENVHYDDDWFNSALVSMGSMGIIYSCIVEVDAQYDLSSMCAALEWNAMKDRLKGVAQPDPFANPNRAVQVVVDPYASGGSRTCYLTTRTQAPASPTRGPVGGGAPGWLMGAVSTALVGQLQANRLLIPTTVTNLTASQQPLGTKQGWGHDVMGGPEPPPVKGLTVEVVFDATPPNTRYLEFADSALEILRAAYAEPGKLGYLGWISLRFQGTSRAYLSPQHGVGTTRRTCTVEFAAAWRKHDLLGGFEWPDTPVLIDRIEAEARKFGGIQHWGLNEGINRDDVTRAYPRLDSWRRVRSELTKSGTISTFDSDFTRRCGLSDPPLPAVTADYDNDGKTDFTVWRPGNGVWYVIDSSTGNAHEQQWGQAGDVSVPGDYDGDGKTDYAVWRPSNGVWYVIDSSTGTPREQQWGQTGDIPVPGHYGARRRRDRKTDFAVWRPGNGVWYVIDGSTGTPREQQWGQAGDIPVPGRYDSDNNTDFAVWRPSNGVWYVIDSTTGTPREQQ